MTEVFYNMQIDFLDRYQVRLIYSIKKASWRQHLNSLSSNRCTSEFWEERCEPIAARMDKNRLPDDSRFCLFHDVRRNGIKIPSA